MVHYIGLDVHRDVAQACIVDEQGTVVRQERFDLTRERLLAFAQARLRACDKLALEATFNTWEVVRLLEPYVAEVVVSNPLATKAIAQAKVKTDKVDAKVLAQLLRCDYLPRVWRADEATQELRQLTSRRASLVSQQTAIKNRIHSVLAARLIRLPVSDLFGTKGQQWLAKLELAAQDRMLIDSDLRVLEAVQTEMADLDRVLAQKGYSDERVKLLMTLPGVSVAVALGLLAALGDMGRFAEADDAAAYLGLVPKVKQSAHKCYRGSITKEGNSHARWLVIQAAQHVARHPGPLGVFFRRLKKRKNHNVAVVAAARKLVTIAWHMLTKNEPYRYAVPRSTEEKLRKLRVQATGEKRQSGPAKGSKTKAKKGERVRTIRSLADVYESEGLPQLQAAPAGEARTVAQSGCQEYVATIGQEQQVVKARPTGKAAAQD